MLKQQGLHKKLPVILAFYLLSLGLLFPLDKTYAFDLEILSRLHPEMISVQQNKIEYFRFGQGTPIVLISGYSANISSWNKFFLADLANKHEVIIFNNRNVGESFHTAAPYNTESLAEDTHQLIEKLHLHKPSILGVSMGGMVAAQYAISYPKKIDKLILVNTAIAGKAAVAPEPIIENILLQKPTPLLKRYVKGMEMLSSPRWWLPLYFALKKDRLKLSTHRDPAVTKNTLIQQQQLIFTWKNNQQAAKKISQLTMPVLILSGGADKIIPPINSDILAKKIKHAHLIRWQDGAHVMIFQYPHEIANTINTFIDKK